MGLIVSLFFPAKVCAVLYILAIFGVVIYNGERGKFKRFRFFICQASGMFVSLPMTYDDATLLWRVITLRKRNVSLQLEPAKFKVNNDKEETRRL